MRIILGIMLAALTSAILAGPAPAQDPAGVTDQQRLLERFEDDKLPQSRLDEENGAQGMAISRTAAEQHRFTLTKLRFAGMTIYGVDDMQPFYADMIGSEISLADILDVADLIEEKYDRDGYTSADVLLRAMPSANGTVTLNVIEKY